MFWGPQSVFLDVLSFEERDPHDPTWLPQAQFVRTFLLPLLVNRRYGVPLSQIFTTRRDGLEPEEVYPLLGPLGRLRPRHLSLVSIPVWFGKRSAANTELYKPRLLKNPEQAQFILNSLLRRQQRVLKALRPAEDRASTWSTYTEGNNNYSSTQADAKLEAVRRTLAEIQPSHVLDVGCNTGVFSILAAEIGARVVSIDYDPVVIGRLWKVATRRKLPILPLVVNLAQPTPALGWSNGECRSFLDRAAGSFDAVLMLALLHHLIVTERVPLPEIFAMARRLTRRWLIVEYVAPTDSMFTRLTRGRDYLHQDLNQDVFEEVARRYFRIVRSEQVPGAERRLYLMEALP
jgi:SAM-dependent methyltransferase